MKYKIFWTTKDGREVEDENTFDSEEEAGTYIGIEMTQMETEDVATYKIIKVDDDKYNLLYNFLLWYEGDDFKTPNHPDMIKEYLKELEE